MSDLNQTPPETKKTEKAAGTLNVYCKLPHGITYILRNGKKLTLNGYLDKPYPGQLAGVASRDAVGGFGVTRNVDAAAWEEIVDDHGDSLSHVNGLIFAHKSERDGTAEAREKKAERNGFEPINPARDPLFDKEQNSNNLPGIQGAAS